MSDAKEVVVSAGFDNIRSHDLRFLQEAAALGSLTVLLWPDDVIKQVSGTAPKFPFEERAYFLQAVRYVNRVVRLEFCPAVDSLPAVPGVRQDIWADVESCANTTRENFCRDQGISYRVFTMNELSGFPLQPPPSAAPDKKKIIVSGSYDWLHSGHIRFLEEACGYGDLYVVVGHDGNIRLLKGAKHPLLPEDERRYMVGSIKHVKQALISSGDGWLDADPEIRRIQPDIYAVNEDGDRGGKREYCQRMGIEYLVLKRVPAPGLPSRSSTELRGF